MTGWGGPVEWGPSWTSLNVSKGSLYSEILFLEGGVVPAQWGPGGPCMVRSNASRVMVTWDPPNRKTHDGKHYLRGTSLAGGKNCHTWRRSYMGIHPCHVKIFWADKHWRLSFVHARHCTVLCLRMTSFIVLEIAWRFSCAVFHYQTNPMNALTPSRNQILM